MTTAILTTIAIVMGVLILGFAAIGIWICTSVFTVSSRSRERARIDYQTRHAEAEIVEIGRRAQEAILAEALRRVTRPGGRWSA